MAMRKNLWWYTATWMNLIKVMFIKEARHKRLYTAWFHYYNVQKQQNYSMVLEVRIVITFGGKQWSKEVNVLFLYLADNYIDMSILWKVNLYSYDLHIVWCISIKSLLFKKYISKSIRIGSRFNPIMLQNIRNFSCF